MLLMELLRHCISQQMHNVQRVPVLVLAPVQHRRHAVPVVVAVLLQTTKECSRSRNPAVHVAAMASLLKTHVPRVVELALNVVRVK
jgi:hypothetical protein